MKGGPKIAVIGGGSMGLAVACELTRQGLEPVILEADNRLGGMAASFDFAELELELELERYYHFHCLSDQDFFCLLEELHLTDKLHWRQTRMGFFLDGRLYPWGSVGAVLSFPRLPLISKLRYLAHAARCLTLRDWRPLDGTTATAWLRGWLGERAHRMLWHKLFAYKFFHHSDNISAAGFGAGSGVWDNRGASCGKPWDFWRAAPKPWWMPWPRRSRTRGERSGSPHPCSPCGPGQREVQC